MVDLTHVKDIGEWPKLRGEIDKAVLSVIGPLPKERPELQVKVVDEVSFPGYVRKRVNYFADEWDRVSAWVFVPEGKDMVPSILCCHRQVDQGKDEPAGLEGDPLLAFAIHYAEQGYVTMATDCVSAGERVFSGAEPYDGKTFARNYPKLSMLGKMLWDHIQAVDVLCEMRRVDASRIGVVGHELGAVNALMLGAFDHRIQTCVASCGFVRLADDEEPEKSPFGQFAGSCPRPKGAGKKKDMPFDWEHILALAAPCPTLLIASDKDAQAGALKSCDTAVGLARRIHHLLGAENALATFNHDAGQRMAPEALSAADDWFDRWL